MNTAHTKPNVKPGQRITCLRMPQDPNPIPSGSQGTVLAVLSIMGDWHIEVAWDSGRTLALIASVDKFAVR